MTDGQQLHLVHSNLQQASSNKKKSLMQASIYARGAIFLFCFFDIINAMGIMDRGLIFHACQQGHGGCITNNMCV